jgi:DNA polymerase elongation subunit (family B)
MIVDAIYHDDEPPTIYKRYRDNEGMLIADKVEGYKPHFYVPQSTPEFRLKSLKRSFPQSEIDMMKNYEGLDGTPLYRVSTNSPYNISRMREMFARTYEADVRYADQYLIENVTNMPKWKPRKWWYDIECNTGDDNFTTVIAVIDSDLDTPMVFAWADETTNCPYKRSTPYKSIMRKVRDTEYELMLCGSEEHLYDSFIQFLQERDPDMMIAHAGTFFDIPHMIERLDKIYGHGGAAKLSPLGIIRYPKKGERYRFDDQPIAGRWQFDTAAPATSGTGFERVWKDSGGGQLPNRKLNTIAETLGLGSKLTEEIEGMDVHNGWYEYWSEFVDYCLLDTVLLKGIDETRNVTDFFVEMVRLCGVSIQSATNVTNFMRGLVSRRTHLKAPSRYRAEKVELEGAEFITKEPGLYEGVAIIDYKGLYPSLITGHNLCYTTKRDGPGDGIIQLENGSYWDQRKKGILPEVVDYLFDFREECRQKMRDAETKEERSAWNTTQSAVKRVMASLYGATAHIGFGWADTDIAQTILSEGRRCIRLLDTVATRLGYNVLYGFTDSAFIQVPQQDAMTLAARVTDAVQEATGNKKLFAELEAYVPYWFFEKKNKYAGMVSWPPEDEGKMKTANFLKGSSLAPISKEAEKIALTMICQGKNEAEVREEILKLALPVRKGDVQLKQVTKQTRISQAPRNYKILSGASKAAEYYNNNMSKDDPFVAGDSVKWTYVKSVPAGLPPTQVVAYREDEEMDGFVLDAKVILDKAIVSKLKGVYQVLGWDLDAATGEPRPATYW